MIEIRSLDTLSCKDWDDYVVRFSKSQLLHTTRWKSLLEEVYGFEPMHFAALAKGQIVGVFPAYSIKSFGRRKLVTAPFGFYCDPLYDN